MKQKSDISRLGKLATKIDVKDIKKSLRDAEKSLRAELSQLEERVEQSDEHAKEYRDEILTKLDGVMGELKTIREETSIGAHQVFELKEEVDGHEKRITHLEESRLPA